MTKQDRINQAKRLLALEGPDYSNAAIAKLTGLTKFEVAAMRPTPPVAAAPSVATARRKLQIIKCKHPQLRVLTCELRKGPQWGRIRECKECGETFKTVEVLTPPGLTRHCWHSNSGITLERRRCIMFKNLFLVALMLFAWPSLAAADELSGYQMPVDQLVIQVLPLDADTEPLISHVARCITVTGETTQPVNSKVTSAYVEYVLEVIAMSTDKSLPLEVGWRSHTDI